MESIADLLKVKPQQPEKRRPQPSQASKWQQSQTQSKEQQDGINHIMASDPEAEPYAPPEPETCPFCKEKMYAKGIRMANRVLWVPFSAQCSCKEYQEDKERKEKERQLAEEKARKEKEAEEMRQRVRKIIGESGMRERFLRRTFENYTITEKNKAVHKVARAYVDNFTDKLPGKGEKLDRNGLFITGGVGVGKTHIVAAMANHLMQEGRPVICMTMIDLLDRIKRTYDKSTISEGEVLRLYETIPLLIIDDMGKEPPTEWGVSKIYTIINSRYEAYMPTIVTSNYDDRTLVKRLTPDRGDGITAEAIIDRLREMCGGILMDGPSWRSR